jgi:hypothetical protein
MDDQRTCGKGLAEHSVVPAKAGELIAALAENLEVHRTALDLSDETARKEQQAYLELARAHRNIAAQLQAAARQMSGYRDLPMGRHDPQAMSGQKVVEAFRRFVALERELLALLEERLEQDQRMLAAMGGRGA